MGQPLRDWPGLCWRDVDLNTRRVTIKKSKTKAGERTVTPCLSGPIDPLRGAKRRQRAALRKLDVWMTEAHPVCPAHLDWGARVNAGLK